MNKPCTPDYAALFEQFSGQVGAELECVLQKLSKTDLQVLQGLTYCLNIPLHAAASQEDIDRLREITSEVNKSVLAACTGGRGE
jgi:hypothetical protein